ncbi:hypothetical protein ABZ912_37805 [Nonomuraea angiospora]|uniref:hypothetical protein n=1 Tax=Nonomuraea angiospora TaxID=46172 RepID=UPI0033C6E55E
MRVRVAEHPGRGGQDLNVGLVDVDQAQRRELVAAMGASRRPVVPALMARSPCVGASTVASRRGASSAAPPASGAGSSPGSTWPVFSHTA